jgi:hypothetical protein
MIQRSIPLVISALVGVASARPAALAPYDTGKLTVSLPTGWKVTAGAETGVIAARQDPGRKDAAAVLLIVQQSGATKSEDELLDVVASSVSKDLRVSKRLALPSGGHVMVADGTADTIKVRVGVMAFAANGASLVCLLVSKPSEFDRLGGLELVTSIITSIKTPATAAAAPPATPYPPADSQPTTVNGKLVIPPLTHRIALTDLAGEWKHDDGIINNYVNIYTGASAGFDAIRYTDKWTFDGKGGVFSEFFGISTANGVSSKIVENKPGAVSLASNMVLTIKWKTGSQQEYVVRGLVELPTMTVITLNGPYYDKGVPDESITDPNKAMNLDQHWIRKKTAK